MTQIGNNAGDLTPPEIPAAARTYGTIAMRGAAWMSMTIAVSKAAGIGSTWVIGLLLAKDDFALYALAIMMAGMVSVLRDGGAIRVLIKRGHEYERLARPVLQMSIMFNLAAAGLLAASAPLAARFFDAPDLPPLMWVMAASITLMAPVMRLRARLAISLRFGAMARVETMSVIVRHGSMVALALLGFGPFSFVIPWVIVAVFEWIMYGRAAAQEVKPLPTRLTWPLFRNVFADSKWVMAAAFAAALMNYGDYLAIGRLQTKEVLGIYFFGFTLSAAFATLFGDGMRNVLMPTFTQVSGDPERHGRAFIQTVRLVSFVFTPIFVGAALAVAPLIDLLWAGKWNASIPVVQILLISLVFRVLMPLALAGMESRGRWRMQAILMYIDGVGTVAAAAIGSLWGGLIEITVCVAAYRAAIAVIKCMAAAGASGVRKRTVILAVAPPAAIALPAAAVGLGVVWLLGVENTWAIAIISGGAFTLLYFPTALLAMPCRRTELIQRVRAMLKRTPLRG